MRREEKVVIALVGPDDVGRLDQRPIFVFVLEYLDGVPNCGDTVVLELLKHDGDFDNGFLAIVTVAAVADAIPIAFVRDIQFSVCVSKRRRVNGTAMFPGAS